MMQTFSRICTKLSKNARNFCSQTTKPKYRLAVVGFVDNSAKGQDALFINEGHDCFGIFDGVSALRDSGKVSDELSNICNSFVNEYHDNNYNSKEILIESTKKLSKSNKNIEYEGSTTAMIVQLKNNRLQICNAGDGSLKIYRPELFGLRMYLKDINKFISFGTNENELGLWSDLNLFKQFFDMPSLQFLYESPYLDNYKYPAQIRNTIDISDVDNINYDYYELNVEEGDFIVAATDGFTFFGDDDEYCEQLAMFADHNDIWLNPPGNLEDEKLWLNELLQINMNYELHRNDADQARVKWENYRKHVLKIDYTTPRKYKFQENKFYIKHHLSFIKSLFYRDCFDDGTLVIARVVNEEYNQNIRQSFQELKTKFDAKKKELSQEKELTE